jgi:predicted nucleic acid-binding protein
MRKVFLDSSAWLAVADPQNQNHQAAAKYFLGLIRRGDQLVTSSDVLTQTYDRFQHALGPGEVARFHRTMKSARRQGLLHIVAVDSEITRKAWDIFERYHDQLSSFRHCTSFVVAGRLGIQDVFSFHQDFDAIGFRVWPRPGANGDGHDLTV